MAQPHPSSQHTLHNPPTVIPEPEPENSSPNTTDITNQTQVQTLASLIAALPTKDYYHIKTLIQQLPNQWSGYNTAGTLITRRQLVQSTWGELKEADSLQTSNKP
jgi:hypothetical protein